MTTPIHGTCDPCFAAVKAAFANNFSEHDDLGASVAITLNGEFVVDLWGGFMDGAGQLPWRADTLCVIYSLSKSLCALCVERESGVVGRGG